MRVRSVSVHLILKWSTCITGIALLCETSLAASPNTCTPYSSRCINSDILWPHPGKREFVALGPTQLLEPYEFSVALVTTYQYQPITIQVPSPKSMGIELAVIENQLNTNLLFAYGVLPRLQLDVILPFTLMQSGAGMAPLSGGEKLRTHTLRDMRFGFAYRLPSTSSPSSTLSWSLVSRLQMTAPTGDPLQLAGEGIPVIFPSLALGMKHHRLLLGVETGARIRPTSTWSNLAIGTQISMITGVGYDLLPSRKKLIAFLEAWALPTFPVQKSLPLIPKEDLRMFLIPSEWMLSLQATNLFNTGFNLQFGSGTALPWIGTNTPTEPQFRFVIGLAYLSPSGLQSSLSSPSPFFLSGLKRGITYEML
ncbi:hypothetical protein [Pajaroellobacter abortibovis]|uniref:hypothetical protein n=1 Tax=Pajaroellobacter abortibovis TaxID=1882918 RepID=UPI0012EC46BA|nr:hypothetical protein [Pajaroellobacter abortibovis]